MLREVTQAFVTRQDWPLHKRVNRILRRMGELGLIQRSQANSVFNYKLKSHRITRGKKYKSLSMKQMNFTIFILVGGYACSVIVFVAELIIHRHVKKDRERKKRE
jgi:membrane peptidoglycan carboxypeptidase